MRQRRCLGGGACRPRAAGPGPGRPWRGANAPAADPASGRPRPPATASGSWRRSAASAGRPPGRPRGSGRARPGDCRARPAATAAGRGRRPRGRTCSTGRHGTGTTPGAGRAPRRLLLPPAAGPARRGGWSPGSSSVPLARPAPPGSRTGLPAASAGRGSGRPLPGRRPRCTRPPPRPGRRPSWGRAGPGRRATAGPRAADRRLACGPAPAPGGGARAARTAPTWCPRRCRASPPARRAERPRGRCARRADRPGDRCRTAGGGGRASSGTRPGFWRTPRGCRGGRRPGGSGRRGGWACCSCTTTAPPQRATTRVVSLWFRMRDPRDPQHVYIGPENTWYVLQGSKWRNPFRLVEGPDADADADPQERQRVIAACRRSRPVVHHHVHPLGRDERTPVGDVPWLPAWSSATLAHRWPPYPARRILDGGRDELDEFCPRRAFSSWTLAVSTANCCANASMTACAVGWSPRQTSWGSSRSPSAPLGTSTLDVTRFASGGRSPPHRHRLRWWCEAVAPRARHYLGGRSECRDGAPRRLGLGVSAPARLARPLGGGTGMCGPS